MKTRRPGPSGARERAGRRARRWYTDTLTLRAVTFPVYAVEDWPAG